MRDFLVAQGLTALRDSAELLVTELVSNVVLHVGGTVCVTVTGTPDGVLLEVRDESRVRPQLRGFSRTAGTGRGMRLVHSLAAEHGMRFEEPDGGKTVWCRLAVAAEDRDEQALEAEFAGVDWLSGVEDPRHGSEATALLRAA